MGRLLGDRSTKSKIISESGHNHANIAYTGIWQASDL